MVTPTPIAVRASLPVGTGVASAGSAHPVLVRGPGSPGERRVPPLLLKRTEAEFIPGLLADLKAVKPAREMGLPESGSTLDYEGGRRRLFQPVHHVFNLAVLEVVCDRPGYPRIDPRRFVSAGCVVRRVVDVNRPELDEAWLRNDGAVLGWRAPGSGRSASDPDPKLRVRNPLSMQRALHDRLIDRILAVSEGVETVSPLFLTPPEVADAAGRTLVYGVVPVTSAEVRTVPRDEAVDDAVVQQTTPDCLRALSGNVTLLPAGFVVTADAVDRAVSRQENPPANAAGIRELVEQLRMIESVWRAFDATPTGVEVLRQLNRVTVQLTATTSGRLGDFLGQAVRRLVLRTEAGDVVIPAAWPRPGEEVARSIRAAAKAAMQARLRTDGPRVRRFDEAGALYRVHCFVRVRCGEECPPEIHWAPPSEAFAIVPWWDASGGPVHTIALPDLNRENVKNLKPNVAFLLPPGLAALLNQSDPKDLRDGKAPGLTLGLGWICSFSIPVISICAFIVLNIFLSLFHLIFGWLFYLKICLPFPKVSSPPKP